MMDTNTLAFLESAKTIFQERIYTDYLRRFAYGVDASCYRYVPQIVVKPKNEQEVRELFALSKRFHMPLTFRAAGTSLSGQACSDSILVIANALWQKAEVDKNADHITLSCGVIGSEANQLLKPFGKKIGPDLATINHAMIGGIFSNNSSGMCCGVKQNSYHTVKSIRVILHDGFILDTSDEKSLYEFKQTHVNMIQDIQALREEILNDPELTALIKRKFAIKNTTGYSLNALLDFEDIKDILNHIFIGAEGTLGFISSVTYECVQDYEYKACALLFYENLATSSKAITILAQHDHIVSAAEIMDYGCLQSVSHLEDIPEVIRNIQPHNCCLLVQLESDCMETLKCNINTIQNALKDTPSLFGIHFSFDAKEQESWWKIRKGILPIAAATRRNASTVITEDICFEIEHFAKGMENITHLFEKHDFHGIIFGHALSGNVHFIIIPLLDDPNERERFACFMDDMVESVITLNGSTKAEHGTGRMMAPFVEKEWGSKAYGINQKIKAIFDPKNLINPDVIICDDPKIHLKNLKPSTQVEDFINQCMECGFCEKVCPSKNLTLTPRQRIAVRREITRLENLSLKTTAQEEELKDLLKDYPYFAIDTCATCSMCQSSCPLEIDTAKITLSLKPAQSSPLSNYIAQKIARNFSSTLNLLKPTLSFAHIGLKSLGNHINTPREKIKNLKIKRFLKIPQIPSYLPQPNPYPLNNKMYDTYKRNVLYFSACMNRLFAPSQKMPDTRSIQEVFENVCLKAGINVLYPKNLENLCCGKAFKDHTQASDQIAYETYKELVIHAGIHNGMQAVDIVCDHSACSHELAKRMEEFAKNSGLRLKIYDMPQYIAQILLQRLHITPIQEDIALYAMCATKKGKYSHLLTTIAAQCTQGKVISHDKTQCCGFAGNKGFSIPELNDSALHELQEFYSHQSITKGYASSSTCEIGLSEKTNFAWQHILYLVDACASQNDHCQ